MTVKLHHDRKQQEAVHDHGPGIVDCHDVGVAKFLEEIDLSIDPIIVRLLQRQLQFDAAWDRVLRSKYKQFRLFAALLSCLVWHKWLSIQCQD